MSEAARQKVFEDVIGRIPATWKCVRCTLEFSTAPDGVPPYARQTERRDGLVRVVGDICEPCYLKMETKQ